MTRKDSEKDSDRPHYYSQFWLDVAAGRRIIGTPKPNEDDDLELEAEPTLLSKVDGRNNVAVMSDGYTETIAHPEVEPEFEQEEYAEPEFEDVEQGNEVNDIVMPDATVDETEIPDVDFAPLDEGDEDEDEEEFFEDEDEDEDDPGWGGARGRKKPKPGRQAKLPSKKPKREPRRGF